MPGVGGSARQREREMFTDSERRLDRKVVAAAASEIVPAALVVVRV